MPPHKRAELTFRSIPFFLPYLLIGRRFLLQYGSFRCSLLCRFSFPEYVRFERLVFSPFGLMFSQYLQASVFSVQKRGEEIDRFEFFQLGFGFVRSFVRSGLLPTVRFNLEERKLQRYLCEYLCEPSEDSLLMQFILVERQSVPSTCET